MFFLTVALVLLTVTPVAAQDARIIEYDRVVGSPELDASVTENRLSPGSVTELEVTVSNSGEVTNSGPEVFERRVKTARNAEVSIAEDRLNAPVEVKTGTVVTGDIGDGAPRTATFRIETEEDAEPGRYQIPIRVEYDTNRVVRYAETTTPPGYTNPSYRVESQRDAVIDAEVVFESEPRFEVTTDDAAGLYAGDTGTLTATVENTGDETARDTTVRFESGSENIGFGPLTNPRSSTAVSGSNLEPGEQTAVTTKINAAPETTEGEYPLSVRVEYENKNGVEDVSQRIPGEVGVGAEREFSIENLETESLRVGENDVFVSGRIINEGPATAHEAVVTVSSQGAIRPTGSESAVGDLDPGESEPVEFKLAVGEDAEPGSKLLSFGVEYENSDGDVRGIDTPIRERVTVGEELDTFEVADVVASVNVGGSGTVELEVRNTGEHAVDGVNAKMFLNDPLSSSDNSAFLGDMEPGETKIATFSASATGDALPKEYDASLEVRYDDRTGDTELEDGITFGIPVGESSGGVPLPFVGAALLVVAASGAVFVYRRD